MTSLAADSTPQISAWELGVCTLKSALRCVRIHRIADSLKLLSLCRVSPIIGRDGEARSEIAGTNRFDRY